MKLTQGAAIVARMLGQHQAYINRAATVAAIEKDGNPARVTALVSRESGEPFEVAGVLLYAHRHDVPGPGSDVVAWPAEEAAAAPKPAGPTREQLDAELAGLPGAWKNGDEAVADLRKRYGKLFTKADEAKIHDFKPAPSRELLDAALARLPDPQHSDPDLVVKQLREFFGELFTAADEAKVRDLVKKPS